MGSEMNPLVEAGGKSLIEKIVDPVTKFVRRTYRNAKVDLGVVYTSYLEKAFKRYNQKTTLATGYQPRCIIGEDSIYVNVGVEYKTDERRMHGALEAKQYEANSVIMLSQIRNHLLIIGTGGAGKSMLFRYLFLKTIIEGERIPVLIELNRVKELIEEQGTNKVDIAALIALCMRHFDLDLPQEQFRYSLDSGRYVFLFDGLDEVPDHVLSETAEAIEVFASKYPENYCFVSSRPGRNFAPLETFQKLHTMDLTKEQAIELSGKLWEPDEKVRAFCRQLDKELYERHDSFAKNPLLLTMMFLTFMNNNQIPDHEAEFYEKCYDALYHLHDSQDKGYYRREFRCASLGEKDFKRLFARFCFLTHFDGKYEFTERQILTLLEESIEKLGLPKETKAEDYLADLCDGVCLLVKEGELSNETYKFAHRSFQTYFAAVYVEMLPDEQQKAIFTGILNNGIKYLQEESVFGEGAMGLQNFYELLWQIERERMFLNAFYERFTELVARLEGASNRPVALFRAYAGQLTVFRSDSSIFYGFNASKTTLSLSLFGSLMRIYLNDKYAKKSRKWGKLLCEQEVEQSRERFATYLTLDRLDHASFLTDAEREQLYDDLAHYFGMPELLHKIEEWLDKIKQEKQERRKAENFFSAF